MAYSQTNNYSISGFIITNNKSVNGQVSIKNLNQNKTANEKGYVKFENLTNGIYYLNIHAPGIRLLKIPFN